MNQNSSNFDPSANTSIAFGGAIDNTFGSGGFFNGDQHLNFNCFKECVINSAMIYSESNNTVTFELRNSSGNVLDDTTLNIVPGQQRVDLEVEIICDNISSVSFNCINQVNCIDPGDGSGFYSTLEDCELECFNVSINNQNIENFSIFSNPIKDVLSIDFKDNNREIFISVFDAIGNIVYINKVNSYQGLYSINTSDFSNGVYFIEIKENHYLQKQKFLVY